MSVKEGSKHKRYELVAPDGGWGYMICIATIINMISLGSFVSCFGIMYNEIYIELDMNSTSVALLNAIGSVCVSIAGFSTVLLLNFITIRQLGLIAAILVNLGSIGVVFVNSKFLFFLCIGVFQSFGNGILLNISYSVLNLYFVKKRMLAVSVTNTVTGIVTLFSSRFVKWGADEYGHRGSLILVSAIFMQLFVAITLMQPVEWHMKRVETTGGKESEMKPFLVNEEDKKENSNVPTVTLSDAECDSTASTEKRDQISDEVKESSRSNFGLKSMLKEFLDVKFLRSFLLSNASIGMAVSVVSDVTFVLMLPQALYFVGWSEKNVAWAISFINFGDLATKVMFILFNNILLRFGNSEIYIVGLIIAFFSRLGMLWSDDPTVMLVFITIMGVSRCVVVMFIPLVIADSVGENNFTSAMGIFMLLYGIIFLILGPVIGAIRDLTNSYTTAYYILTSCFGIVIIFWLIELLYKKNKHKRKKIKVDVA